MRSTAVKAAVTCGNFGGTNLLCRSMSSDKDSSSGNSETLLSNKENKAGEIEKNRISNDDEKSLASRIALREKNSEGHRVGLGVVNTAEVLRQMLIIEEHHIEDTIIDSSGSVKDIVWCPVYLRPVLKGTARGGDEISHHKCKSCQQICFHLLNDGEKYRPCLRCAGWNERGIPSWYYHDSCKHCREL